MDLPIGPLSRPFGSVYFDVSSRGRRPAQPRPKKENANQSKPVLCRHVPVGSAGTECRQSVQHSGMVSTDCSAEKELRPSTGRMMDDRKAGPSMHHTLLYLLYSTMLYVGGWVGACE